MSRKGAAPGAFFQLRLWLGRETLFCHAVALCQSTTHHSPPPDKHLTVNDNLEAIAARELRREERLQRGHW